jgi:thiol-disulfide isomerase/thioredoxin
MNFRQFAGHVADCTQKSRSNINKMTKFIFRFFTAFVFSTAFIFASAHAQKANLDVVTKTTKIDSDGLRKLAAGDKKHPVLINFWATWCPPCRAEFPELVKIDADYRARGLNFSVVSVDSANLIDTKVPAFLQEFNSTMPSYLIDLRGRPEIARVVRQIAPTFSDLYPLTLLFDKGGKLVYQKIGRVDAKILRREIDKALAEKPPDK